MTSFLFSVCLVGVKVAVDTAILNLQSCCVLRNRIHFQFGKFVWQRDGSVLFNQIFQHKVFNTTHNSNIMSLFKLLCHQAHYCPEARRPNEDKTKSMRFMWRDKDIIQMRHRCEGQINLLWTINQSRQRGKDRELITARNKRTVLLDQTELFKFDE